MTEHVIKATPELYANVIRGRRNITAAVTPDQSAEFEPGDVLRFEECVDEDCTIATGREARRIIDHVGQNISPTFRCFILTSVSVNTEWFL